MNYWLIKSDPDTYSFEQMLKDKITIWDGVRNYQARNYLAQMKKGDKLLFYHSGKEKSIVGIVSLIEESFPDPTTDDPAWLAVKVGEPKKFDKKISINEMKNNPILKNMLLFKQSRLSVMPLSKDEFNEITRLAKN